MRYLRVVGLLALVTVSAASAAAQPAQAPSLDLHGDPLPEGVVARLGSTRFQAAGRVEAVVLSPDGSTLASAVRDPKRDCVRVDFMDTATGRTFRKLDLPDHSVSQMQFTPDGGSLLLNGWAALSRFDLATGKPAWSIEGGQGGAFALSSDGKRIATQSTAKVKDAPVRLWDATTMKKIAVLPGRGASSKALKFSPDGKRLLLWSIEPIRVDENGVSTFGNESKSALACIDLGTGKIVGETKAGPSQFVALCPDGETIALEDAERTGVRVLHLPSGAERCVIPAKQAQFAFSPSGKILLTLDVAGQAALWDAAKGSKIRDLEGGLVQRDHRLAGFSENGKTVAAVDGGWDSTSIFVVWNAETGQRAKRPPGHDASVTCLAYAPDGKRLASGSMDNTARLWNPATSEYLRLLVTHAQPITALAFSPDGTLLASSSKDGVTRLTRAADGRSVADFVGPDKGATALAFAPDGRTLFAGGDSSEVLAWELAGAKVVVQFKAGRDGSVAAFTNHDGLALTTNSEYRFEGGSERLQLWNPFTKLQVAQMPLRYDPDDPSGNVRCEAAACSRDGRMIAASQVTEKQGIRPYYDTPLLRVWERASGQPFRILGPTVTKVLAFAPNGRLLACGGAGQSGHLRVGYGPGIDLWDVPSGRKLAALPGSPGCLAFSPLGSQLAAGGQDQAILILQAPPIPAAKQAKEASAQQREAWWTALGGDAKEAYQAIGQMLDAPDQAAALLKERVGPVGLQEAAAVAKLIELLDSAKFAERDQAQSALAKMGEGASGTIKAALGGKISIEMKGRLELLLRKSEATSATSLRHHRAVAMLEWIGTPDARAQLRALADGAPDARRTIEALAALKRQ